VKEEDLQGENVFLHGYSIAQHYCADDSDYAKPGKDLKEDGERCDAALLGRGDVIETRDCGLCEDC
jgi:hypothetical protein